MFKAVEEHERDCPICQSNYREHCHERETVIDFAELTAERDQLRAELDRLAPALPVLDGIVRLVQAVKRSGKPHRCELLFRDGDTVTKGVTLWGAYGPGNPMERIAELVSELERLKK